ncbi:MAG: excinuclease ABC subunit UvrC [Candidatus Saccharimonadales bacterium]
MNQQLAAKLKTLPKSPGVYFHKNADGEIIYVGKAAVLRNRVRQYFQASRVRDPKTDLLVSEIVDTDWIVVDSEADALFLEAEMVRRYMPRYNIMLRDDKSSCYIRIDARAQAPTVSVTRRPLDDGADYYGPFLQAGPVRKALRYLRKAFPYSTHTTLPPRGCLQYHLGLCPGPETPQYDRQAYLKNIKKLVMYINGERTKVVRELEKEMESYAKQQQFEQAAILRNKLRALKSLQAQVLFGDKEALDLSKDHALADITELLTLAKPPRRIEGYDISHMSGTDTVASMVVFTNGVSDKPEYRKFKMRIPGNDDFAHMNEVIKRRLSEKNIKAWGLPQLMLIDGGKGQLGAAIKARDELGITMPMVGLAKKFEEIVVHKEHSSVTINDEQLRKLKGFRTDESDDFVRLDLPDTSHVVKLLQRIRDESHRFAVSYHSVLKTNRQTTSVLDEIPGVGPTTKKQLIRAFGSAKGVQTASKDELATIVGPKKAAIIYNYFVH